MAQELAGFGEAGRGHYALSDSALAEERGGDIIRGHAWRKTATHSCGVTARTVRDWQFWMFICWLLSQLRGRGRYRGKVTQGGSDSACVKWSLCTLTSRKRRGHQSAHVTDIKARSAGKLRATTVRYWRKRRFSGSETVLPFTCVCIIGGAEPRREALRGSSLPLTGLCNQTGIWLTADGVCARCYITALTHLSRACAQGCHPHSTPPPSLRTRRIFFPPKVRNI